MKLLLDAHLPPSLAPWIKEAFDIDAFSFDYLGWRTMGDEEAFLKARSLGESIIMTKDDDFVTLLSIHKAPPKIIWITTGNTSKQNLKEILEKQLKSALQLLNDNDLVEIK